jgi:hypothetical protein
MKYLSRPALPLAVNAVANAPGASAIVAEACEDISMTPKVSLKNWP